jgi:dTDP-4-amino-4,6-dideoxygalactose transaminase
MLLPSNPRANYLAHKKEIDDAIARVLNSGQYILGQEVKEFENEFARYISVRLGVGVSSGTDALYLALRACGIKEGDEVITVSHTAVGTVAAIELCGATPVLIDINPSSYTIDPDQIEQAATQRTKAIIPVHLYGHPAEMTSILDAASRHKLFVIEDCAQSHGASYKGRKTGAWGDIAAFSFYPTKNLGAIGDGGIVVTDKPALADRVRMLREYGWKQRYISDLPGANSRLDELQAAILRIKLRHLDEENEKRQNLARVYSEELAASDLTLPACSPKASHVYHQYVVRSKRRDSLKEFLAKKNIATLVHYPVPIHMQPAYQGRLKCIGNMANTENIAKEILSLPMYPELTAEQVSEVASKILSWCQNKAC